MAVSYAVRSEADFELPCADFDSAPAKGFAAVAVTERVFAMLAERTWFVVGPSATLFATTGAVAATPLTVAKDDQQEPTARVG